MGGDYCINSLVSSVKGIALILIDLHILLELRIGKGNVVFNGILIGSEQKILSCKYEI